MNTFPIYLFQRFLYRIKEFIRHWYIKSAKLYWHYVISKLEQIDYTLAWKITLKNLFKPLYKDYSFLGYVLGFIFRSMRLFISSIIYIVLFFIAVGIYLLWILIPPAIIYGILTNHSINY